jgi:UDP-N-acetylmuramate--alanine ligase
VVTYGLAHAEAHVLGTDVELGSYGGRCVVRRRRPDGLETLGTLELAVPGRHSLQNALAVVAVCEQVGLPFSRTAQALATFEGAERRFERRGEAGGVLVIDDYGHHPTEIAAVLSAARATLSRRLVVAFQPHRYSRTARLLEAFGPAFGGADEVVLTDIYAAGEDPMPGVTIERLADAIRQGSGRPVHLVPDLADVVPALVSILRPGDVAITLGAGSIGTVPDALVRALGQRGGRA